MTFWTRFPSLHGYYVKITALHPGRGSLVEITCRTDQGWFLLRPDPVIDDILLGVLGRAQRLYPVEICGFSFLSSHYHILLWVENAQQLAKFKIGRASCRERV